ncbi:hypothetical protein [Rubritalea tangerina]
MVSDSLGLSRGAYWAEKIFELGYLIWEASQPRHPWGTRLEPEGGAR